MNNPRLSVLMPVYNCGDYIEDAIASIQAQTFTDFELLVIDDGCNDKTLDIVKKRARQDHRIKIKSRENRGIVDSLNEGIAMANGLYLARMDGDDICEPHRFSRQLEFLNTHPTIDLVGSWVQLFGSRNEIWHHRREDNFIKYMLLFRTSGMSHSTVMGKTKLFRQFMYDKNYEDVEDTELWSRMATSGGVRFANIPEALVQYRVHDNQVSNIRRERQIYLYRKIMIKYMEALGVKNIDIEAHEWCCDLRCDLNQEDLLRAMTWLENLFHSIRRDWEDDFGVISERWTKLCFLNGRNDLSNRYELFRPISWIFKK